MGYNLCFALLLIALVPLLVCSQTPSSSRPLPEGVTARGIHFYSEGIECYGKLFLPRDFSPESRVAGVVLAPGWGELSGSISRYAAVFASRGLAAMVIDYRGWGRSGGYLETVEVVKTDDRLRFSQMTTRVRIRRQRLLPQHQILDIRNAVYYLQGEPGIDRARVGVWGTDMAGGHVLVVAAVDARIKAAVAQTPIISGKDIPKTAFAPIGELLQAEQKRSRTGSSPTVGLAPAKGPSTETRMALAEYHPFWYVDQVPATTGVLFVVTDDAAGANHAADALAASKLLKGPTGVVRVSGSSRLRNSSNDAFEEAASAAAEWFLKQLTP